jgi:hypothetical protein
MPKIGRPAWSGRRELLMAESFLNWQAGPSNVGIWVKLASARTSINESEVERTRGADSFTESMFTVLKLGDFVPDDHAVATQTLSGAMPSEHNSSSASLNLLNEPNAPTTSRIFILVSCYTTGISTRRKFPSSW